MCSLGASVLWGVHPERGTRGSSVYPAHKVALCPRVTWQLCVPGSRGSYVSSAPVVAVSPAHRVFLGTWSRGSSVCLGHVVALFNLLRHRPTEHPCLAHIQP